MKAISPATEELVQDYEEHSPEYAIQQLQYAQGVFHEWRQTTIAHRVDLMRKAAQIIRARQDEFARLMAFEMGKPVKQGRAEMEKCAWVCEFYAENTASFLQNEQVDTDYQQSFVAFQPIGIVLAVMPWNYPFWQVFRFAAPALMAGNVGVLKHADNVPGCALGIESIFKEAGFPDHTFQSFLMNREGVEPLIRHPFVRAVTLTGSTRAGQAVASTAGHVLKKAVLELGGSDAYLVLKDADLDLAAEKCAQSRLLNSGQSCISAKRFIVDQQVYDEFIDKMTAQMQTRRLGDPLKEDTDLGPMARVDLRDGLQEQVDRSVAKGAKVVIGGQPAEGIIPGKGAYYPPTLLADVTENMAAFDEELFGPVAAVIKADNTDHAVHLSNQSVYGLGGAIFSQDVEAATHLAATQIDSGACFVNDFVKSDPRLPFGGVKESGYGRELSHYGMKEFMNIKTVCVS